MNYKSITCMAAREASACEVTSPNDLVRATKEACNKKGCMLNIGEDHKNLYNLFSHLQGCGAWQGVGHCRPTQMQLKLATTT